MRLLDADADGADLARRLAHCPASCTRSTSSRRCPVVMMTATSDSFLAEERVIFDLVRHDGISHRVGPLSVGTKRFRLRAHHRVLPRPDFSARSVAQFLLPSTRYRAIHRPRNNRRLLIGKCVLQDVSPIQRRSLDPPRVRPWAAPIGKSLWRSALFLIRAPGFTEYVNHRLIASDDALFFRF